jgi:probable rRNA maturation factor
MSGIKFFFEDIERIPLSRTVLKNNILDMITEEKFTMGEISIIFTSDDYLLKMNREYLDHDYYTDIITFNYGNSFVVAGDLFISLDRVRENADLHSQTFNRELHRVIFHGILHLMGYNDKEKDEEVLMREKEDFYLNKYDI